MYALSLYTRVSFTFTHFFCLLLQHLLCSSSKDRDGKAAKDEKGKKCPCVRNMKTGEHLSHFIQLDAISVFLMLFFFFKYPITALPGVVSSSSNSSSSRNIWVSGLSSNTKAADLKNLFGKYGKVNNVCIVFGMSCCVFGICVKMFCSVSKVINPNV